MPHRGPTDHRSRAAHHARGRPARVRRAAAHAGSRRQLGARRARPHAVRVRRRRRWSGARRAYTFELTMPGGACVPVAGVSSVAVQPTHRRRGVLTAMMGALHDDARDARRDRRRCSPRRRASIYRRFGYGAGHLAARLLDRPRSRAASRGRSSTPGACGSCARGEADVIYRRSTTGARRAVPGMVSRPDFWWPEVFWVTEPGHALFEAVHEDADGRADGYVSYEIKGEWYGGFADREHVRVGPPGDQPDRARRAVGVRVRRRPRREDRRDEPAGRRAAAVHARRPAASCAPTS